MSWRTVFGCDLRTLATARVCIALLLLVDLFQRSRFLIEHYTDSGIISRTFATKYQTDWFFSLHFLSGEAFFQGFLFALAVIAALALLIGYRTRLATVASWLLLVSLLNRNLYVIQAGDILLALLLLWCIFLPVGARYSVDSALNPEPPAENRYFSMATAGILIQCMCVYFFTALLKSDPVWMPQGLGPYFALQLDTFVTPFGEWLRQYFIVVQAASYFVWIIEILAPFLVFSPWMHVRLRLVTLFLLVCMHVGFLFSLRIGLFPFVSLTTLLLFTPAEVWDRLDQWVRKPHRDCLQIYYDRECSLCLKFSRVLTTFLLLSGKSIQPAPDGLQTSALKQRHIGLAVADHENDVRTGWAALVLLFKRSVLFWPIGYLFDTRIFRTVGDSIYSTIGKHRSGFGVFVERFFPWRRINLKLPAWASILAFSLIIYTLFINFRSIPWHAGYRMHDPIEEVKFVTRLEQRWGMFAPKPALVDGWFVIRGTLLDGRTIDVYDAMLTGDWHVPNFDPPGDFFNHYYNYNRWRKFMLKLGNKRSGHLRRSYSGYLCLQWNSDHLNSPSELTSFEIFYNTLTSQPDYKPRVYERHMIWRHWCDEKYKSAKS